jgi:exodeoxyribonuclease V gamma subunit
MAGDASGDAPPFQVGPVQIARAHSSPTSESGHDAYVPYEVVGTEVHDAAALGVLLRSLVADARFAQGQTMTTAAWAAFLRAYVDTYVTPAGSGEADALSRCLRQIQSIAKVDLGERTVGYRLACELARERLASVPVARSGEGIVVSTLAAIRPLPFRVVFACGMGEGRFPSAEAEDPLDLRWAKRRAGDVTARDRDRYAFLELLLAVRDRLVLSYVSRDPLTGDPLAPSSVVQELLQALADGYVRDAAALRRRHPLRRWDERYFPDVFGSARGLLGTMALPEARAEARTLALRRSLERKGGEVTVHDVVARAEAGGTEWVALQRHLGVAPLPAQVAWTDARVVVPMHAIVKFMELPLQGWAEFRLGLDEVDEEDVLARESEPFETALREETLLLRDVLLAAGKKREPIASAYDDVVRRRELRGQGPSGVFARGERADHLRALDVWERSLAESGVPYDAIELHRFGRAREHARADVVHEALVLDVDVIDAEGTQRTVRAEIAGRALPLGPGAEASITLAKRANEGTDPWSAAGRMRAFVRAFVDHAVLSASGVTSGAGHRSILVVATPEKTWLERHDLPPLPQDVAKRWLRDRVRELIAQPHAYFLPCEAVFVHRAGDVRAPVVPVLEDARDRLRGGDGPLALRSAYGPVPRPQEYPIPSEEAARAMIDGRFGPLFASPSEEP